MEELEPYAEANERGHAAVGDCGREVYHHEVLGIIYFALTLLYLWDGRQMIDIRIKVKKGIYK